MLSTYWLTVAVVTALGLLYWQRPIWLISAIWVALALLSAGLSGTWLTSLLLLLAAASTLLLWLPPLRQRCLSAPALEFFKRAMPRISTTEQAALDAGSVWWEGEIFSGNPDWQRLHTFPKPVLSAAEQAFLDGPVEQLCEQLDDWEITHELADLPHHIWDFLKREKFFAMIIPKRYGGLEFSALAHSAVLQKVAGRSATAVSTIAVPNSLGPAELLLKYGTQEQQEYYLPRLASGVEIPCFALTGTHAGSDATALSDTGVICRGHWEDEEIIGIRLNWDKRYITLAPVATVIGLAFKLSDPEQLIGSQRDYGITCALIPRQLPGIEIGRRHLPMNTPFQNGPIRGRDVFVPLDTIIGGPSMAGRGWGMLVECLSVGRAITLPSNATGGAKAAALASGAYARIRRQFNSAIANFEGIQEPLARMAGKSYIMDSACQMTVAAIDLGEAPAVPSAIMKYHLTEMAREIANDALDVHGGKGVMLGPRNYLGGGYQSIPVSITVEGANILTRSMIIFGQGAIRCHPYLLEEFAAATQRDSGAQLQRFDAAFYGHLNHILVNIARALWLSLTGGRLVRVPGNVPRQLRRYYGQVARFSASLALLSDSAMLLFGGHLKKRELISARLGDLLSYCYLLTAVLKRYRDDAYPEPDMCLVEWSGQYLLYRCQLRLDQLLTNLPNRFLAGLLRCLTMPLGPRLSAPNDKLTRALAQTLSWPNSSRQRLAAGLFTRCLGNNPLGQLQHALELAKQVEPLQQRLAAALANRQITANEWATQWTQAREQGLLNDQEVELLRTYQELVHNLIAVDDFAAEKLAAAVKSDASPPLRAVN